VKRRNRNVFGIATLREAAPRLPYGRNDGYLNGHDMREASTATRIIARNSKYTTLKPSLLGF
jgi:hypothetical protein